MIVRIRLTNDLSRHHRDQADEREKQFTRVIRCHYVLERNKQDFPRRKRARASVLSFEPLLDFDGTRGHFLRVNE